MEGGGKTKRSKQELADGGNSRSCRTKKKVDLREAATGSDETTTQVS